MSMYNSGPFLACMSMFRAVGKLRKEGAINREQQTKLVYKISILTDNKTRQVYERVFKNKTLVLPSFPHAFASLTNKIDNAAAMARGNKLVGC